MSWGNIGSCEGLALSVITWTNVVQDDLHAMASPGDNELTNVLQLGWKYE